MTNENKEWLIVMSHENANRSNNWMISCVQDCINSHSVDLKLKPFGKLDLIRTHLKYRNIISEYQNVVTSNPFLLLGETNYCYIFRDQLYNLQGIDGRDNQNIQSIPTRLFLKTLKGIYHADNNHFVVLSHHMQKIIKELHGLSFPVIEAPIQSSKYHIQKKNENHIVTLGFYENSRNQLAQIELAKVMPNYEFIIIGQTNYDKYYQQLVKASERLSNVHLMPNTDEITKNDILSTSKFYLNTERFVDWSIPTCEAVLSGCIPIVPNKDAMVEIVPEDNLRFNSILEVPAIIEEHKDYNTDSLITNAKRWDVDIFKQKFTTFLSQI